VDELTSKRVVCQVYVVEQDAEKSGVDLAELTETSNGMKMQKMC
jgi:hypothetical protein